MNRNKHKTDPVSVIFISNQILLLFLFRGHPSYTWAHGALAVLRVHPPGALHWPDDAGVLEQTD